MYKSLTMLVVAGLLVTGCGGDHEKKTTTTVSSSSSSKSSAVSSSAPASSSVSSSAPSSAAASSSSAPASGNKVLKIDVVDNASPEIWSLQMQQNVKGFVKGKKYKFSFRAKASAEKAVGLQINGLQPSYPSYPITSIHTVTVTTQWQKFEHIIESDVDDSTMDFQGNFSKLGDYTLYLDDISLTDEDGKNEQITGGSMVQVEDWKFVKNNGTGSMTPSIITE